MKKIKAVRNQRMLPRVLWQNYSPGPVLGVDEVGRGCLAGPVYAAAVCLKSDEHNSFFTDSKLLSEKRREELSPLIQENHWFGIGIATVQEIDELNILQASLLAMKRAVIKLEQSMNLKTGHLLVDGSFKVPGLSCTQTAVIKGDLRCTSISAASIVAKVARDQMMKKMGEQFPGYGFEKHKGYGCPSHKAAIESLGPTVHHRKSFSGVKEFLSRLSL